MQDVPYVRLREHLLADDHTLEIRRRWPVPQPSDPASLAGIVVDDLEAGRVQDWPCHVHGKFVGQSYRKARRHKRNLRAFEYSVQLPKAGRYEVRYAYDNAHPNCSHLPFAQEKLTRNENTKPIAVALFSAPTKN